MRPWKGKRTSVGERTTKEKCEPKPKLSLPDQFFMVLVRLRLGRVVEDLADCFYVQLGERPTILDSHSDKVFKRILLTKARRKDVQKSSDISVYNTINREEVRGI